jgi:formylglycine-generating enzyme required for sulfatase activity
MSMAPRFANGFASLVPWAALLLWPAPARPGEPQPSSECAPTFPGMKCIPGGPFVRGNDQGEKDQRPQATIVVDTFYLDTHEVTNADYRACVQAGKCASHGPAYRGFSAPKQPILGIQWFDARDYCGWRGKRLPTEAEWEKAARGPDGNVYPWGNERATCARAIIEEDGKKGCGLGQPPKWATAEVGSRPPGAYGLYDMAGNSWEWVADWYSRSYAECGPECSGPNPKGPCGGADDCPGRRHRVVRGGSWWWPWRYAQGAWRRAHLPGNKPYHHFGFRCAMSPPAAGAVPAGKASSTPDAHSREFDPPTGR